MDIPSDNEDNKLPVLDLKMWVEEHRDDEEVYSQLMHEFYEKTMVSDLMIMKESALP